jgi:hypothetical protein
VLGLRLVFDGLQVAVVGGLPVLVRGVLQPGGRAGALHGGALVGVGGSFVHARQFLVSSGGGVVGVFGELQGFLGAVTRDVDRPSSWPTARTATT